MDKCVTNNGEYFKGICENMILKKKSVILGPALISGTDSDDESLHPLSNVWID